MFRTAMPIHLFYLLIVFSSFNQKIEPSFEKQSNTKFGIVIHGGAGTILKENMSEALEKSYRAKLKEAVKTGYDILKEGGTSLEAVEQTINILENSPLFNAGKGAVFSSREINEMDASIMEGNTLNAGAVSGVTNVKNPISLALALSLIHI